MTHEDRGHYALKHKGKTVEPEIAEKIKHLSKNDQLSCAAAHRIASELKIEPGEVGVQADLMEYRIIQCQLGLFGYFPEAKKLNPDIRVSEELGQALINNAPEGRISCRDCWLLAKKMKISKPDMGSACEQKEIRIKPCQLGAF